MRDLAIIWLGHFTVYLMVFAVVFALCGMFGSALIVTLVALVSFSLFITLIKAP